MPTSLLSGVNSGIRHQQTRLLTAGKSLHPFQRQGTVAPGLGVFPASDTTANGHFGKAPAAAPTSLGTPPRVTFAVAANRKQHV